MDWLDTLSIAQSAIKVNPRNAKVHMSMGNELAQKVRDLLLNCLIIGYVWAMWIISYPPMLGGV